MTDIDAWVSYCHFICKAEIDKRPFYILNHDIVQLEAILGYLYYGHDHA